MPFTSPFRTVLALATIALPACTSVWATKVKSDNYELPRQVTVYVAMSDVIVEEDSGIAGIVVATLTEELTERGYTVEVEVHRAGETPPVPRIELQFVDSSSGSAALRGTGGLMTSLPVESIRDVGADSMTVDCYVVLDRRAAPVFQGRVTTQVLRGLGNSTPRAVGESIAMRIAGTLAD